MRKSTNKRVLLMRDDLMAYGCLAPFNSATARMEPGAAGFTPSAALPGPRVRGSVYRITIELIGVDPTEKPQLWDYLSNDGKQYANTILVKRELKERLNMDRDDWPERTKRLQRILKDLERGKRAHKAALKWFNKQPNANKLL